MDSKPKPRGQWVGNLRAENGAEYINDTEAHEGTFFALVCETDTVLAAITQPHITNSDGRISVSYPQGYVIYGETTSVTLASGSVLAVNF